MGNPSLRLSEVLVGIPRGTNCAPLVAFLFLFCLEGDFKLPPSGNNQADVVKAYNSTLRYLDDLLNIGNPYFEQMMSQIYSTQLQLNRANCSDAEATYLVFSLLPCGHLLGKG